LFVDVCAVKVKEMTNILTSVDQYLWNMRQQREVGKPKASQKAESDWILWGTENLWSLKGWIVLNSELKTTAVLKDEISSRW